MKTIEIKSSGSCDSSTKIGSYIATIRYKEHLKQMTGTILMTTVNRCILTGFILAVEQLNEQCNITLISKTQMGVKKYGTGKVARNSDLFNKLISALNNKSHTYSFVVKTAND